MTAAAPRSGTEVQEPVYAGPVARPRRLKRTAELRAIFAEDGPERARLIYPVFVRPGDGAPDPIRSLPGIFRYPVDRVGALARALAKEEVRAVLLFGRAARKDAAGGEAGSERDVVVRAIPRLRAAYPGLVIFTDVCLCAYTTHGHCGLLESGAVANDPTLERLGQVAAAHAAAGADFVAPSAMMDGQVAEVRRALDAGGHAATGILAYAAKFASSLYAPFREAEGSHPSFGDRKGYQLDPANGRAALRALAAAADEGADILMVKPALPSLDLLARARPRFDLPLAAFQVSGEYAMIRAAADRGWVDLPAAVAETLTAIRRAGADLTITYFARERAAGRERDR
ncbi:MAG: porphobilinogen synthase [Thermoplasmata archaeon]